MNEVITVEEVNRAYADLRKTLLGVQSWSKELLDAKSQLEIAKTAAIVNGEITGKNQTERDAKMYVLLESHYRSVDDAEDKLTLARNEHELARLEIDRLKLLERIVRK